MLEPTAPAWSARAGCCHAPVPFEMRDTAFASGAPLDHGDGTFSVLDDGTRRRQLSGRGGYRTIFGPAHPAMWDAPHTRLERLAAGSAPSWASPVRRPVDGWSGKRLGDCLVIKPPQVNRAESSAGT